MKPTDDAPDQDGCTLTDENHPSKFTQVNQGSYTTGKSDSFTHVHDTAAKEPKTHSERKKSTKLHTRRRKLGEVPTLRVAVMNKCRECRGWEPDCGRGSVKAEVKACADPECWTWPYRLGKLDPLAWESELELPPPFGDGTKPWRRKNESTNREKDD